MNKKVIGILAIAFSLIVLGAACAGTTNGNNTTSTGPTTTTTPTSTTSTPDAAQVVSGISSTGISFTVKSSEPLKWNVVSEEELDGQSISAQNISYDDATKIEKYLMDRGYQSDPLNTTMQGKNITIAYKKDGDVCKINGEVLGNVNTNDQNAVRNARFNVKVNCGSL